MYKNVIFDLDGTLTDSGEGIMDSGKYALRQLGIPVPGEQILRKMVGPPLAVSFAYFGVPEDRIEDAIRLYRDKYINQGGKYRNKVYPGIEAVLCQLKSDGCSLFVATSKPEALAREILIRFGLGSYFEYIAGASPGHSRESKGDVLGYLLDITGKNEPSVMVGDTRFDVAGAHEKNLACVGVTWGYGTREELFCAGADKIIDTPDELPEYLHTSTPVN